MQLTTQGEVNGLINLHGRTKAVTDSEETLWCLESSRAKV